MQPPVSAAAPPMPSASLNAPPRICVVIVTHFYDAFIASVIARMRREAPADHAVFLAFSHGPKGVPGELPRTEDLVLIDEEKDALALPYPARCAQSFEHYAQNVDLKYLSFWHKKPDFDVYWFIEYDVHFEGNWAVFFEYFRASRADLLATRIGELAETPQKEAILAMPLVLPPSLVGQQVTVMLGFYPLCRFSAAALRAFDAHYREGMAGHYEMTLATICRQLGMEIEDVGGNGRYVRPANVNRFYFCTPGTFTLSPGTFVFRPAMRTVLPRRNTLWHPVKPDGLAVWFPLNTRGNLAKNLLEWLKPMAWRAVIRLWFAFRWNPLR